MGVVISRWQGVTELGSTLPCSLSLITCQAIVDKCKLMRRVKEKRLPIEVVTTTANGKIEFEF